MNNNEHVNTLNEAQDSIVKQSAVTFDEVTSKNFTIAVKAIESEPGYTGTVTIQGKTYSTHIDKPFGMVSLAVLSTLTLSNPSLTRGINLFNLMNALYYIGNTIFDSTIMNADKQIAKFDSVISMKSWRNQSMFYENVIDALVINRTIEFNDMLWFGNKLIQIINKVAPEIIVVINSTLKLFGINPKVFTVEYILNKVDNEQVINDRAKLYNGILGSLKPTKGIKNKATDKVETEKTDEVHFETKPSRGAPLVSEDVDFYGRQIQYGEGLSESKVAKAEELLKDSFDLTKSPK